jgi:hypothetical protein
MILTLHLQIKEPKLFFKLNIKVLCQKNALPDMLFQYLCAVVLQTTATPPPTFVQIVN